MSDLNYPESHPNLKSSLVREMLKVDTIGIIGGMGPGATNRLCDLITSLTPATSDQTHIPVITFNNSAIPSRVDAIFNGGVSPLPELVRTARILQTAGADFLLMPCNTAHYYFDEIQASVDIPLFDMIAETVRHIVSEFSDLETIGILGSSPTLDCGLFHKHLTTQGKKVIVPDPGVQIDLVMTSIFGARGIKAGHRDEPRAHLLEAGCHLAEKGANVIIAGCTEVSLVIKDGDLAVPLLDPLKIIAQLAVKRSMIGKLRTAQEQMYVVTA